MSFPHSCDLEQVPVPIDINLSPTPMRVDAVQVSCQTQYKLLCHVMPYSYYSLIMTQTTFSLSTGWRFWLVKVKTCNLFNC